MNFEVSDEFRIICQQIALENLTQEQWREIESDDSFQSVSFCGGYDADENTFCFSYYDAKRKEWWFQLTISEIEAILVGTKNHIEMRKAN